MVKQKYPIGIQSFREIREEGHYYVDKTKYANRLVGVTKHNFLSRPRRFGKSLFVSMLKALFEGKEKLFRGLDIHGHWDWSVRYPVVKLDFGSNYFANPEELPVDVLSQIDQHEFDSGVQTRSAPAPKRLSELIVGLAKQTGQRVVILVDEYDAPILDAIGVPENAAINRDFLAGLYSTIKTSDDYVKFSFFTGISRFSKTSLFSKFNNLWDLTLDPSHSAICGYTEAEIENVFVQQLDGLDREEIREWYNGYNWLGEELVYNPYSILKTLFARKVRPWWFESSTPKFLIEVLRQCEMFPIDLNKIVVNEDLLATFDIDNIRPESLLFQAGYLTIAESICEGGAEYYKLDYPNREVRQSLSKSLLEHLIPGKESEHGNRQHDLHKCIRKGNLVELERILREIFSSIPYYWYTSGDLSKYESYFASVMFVYFVGAGLNVTVEEATNKGRIDMVVETDDSIYLFEFKTLEREPPGSGLRQIEERGYADKYLRRDKTMYLIGAEFDSKERNLVRLDIGDD